MTWSNFDDVMAQMTGAGLLVDQIRVDDFGRCRVEGADHEKRGWYRLHEIVGRSGELLLVGSFGVFQGNSPNAIKIELPRRKDGSPLSDDQRAALRKRIADDRRAAQTERDRQAGRAAARAQRMWQRLAGVGASEYLEKKGVGNHDCKFTPGGALVVPMRDQHERIAGLQFILPPGHKRRATLGRDKTYWPAGLSKQGAHFVLGVPQPGGVILIAEGYATAASLFEATSIPTVVAFDAGNLRPVAEIIAARHARSRILVCADDDYLSDGNPGVTAAAAAALAVGGSHLAPVFCVDRAGRKLTDFNDLQALEGRHAVRIQVETQLRHLGWASAAPIAPAQAQQGGGGSAPDSIAKIDDPAELFERFALVYELPDAAYDRSEHALVPLASVRNLCAGRHPFRTWMDSRDAAVVRKREVGFDPAGTDPAVRCNLWAGWPTVPREGECSTLLDLLHHLCSGEKNADELYAWALKWLAYPIQHPGAKMHSALVFHGPQGTGKSMFFEAYMGIFGEYGRIVDQAAIEDKFNDWASRKLFLIADEVVARLELYHTKNKLKSLITGSEIRINPKNMGAYTEANHCNFVFLSNETQPLVLERDDRRYAVIRTPHKLDERFYKALGMEIADGGAAALHHHLLQLDLGDFAPWTPPPMTEAKRDLIDVSLDSCARFAAEVTEPGGSLQTLRMPSDATQVQRAYELFARSLGQMKYAARPQVTAALKALGWVQRREDVRYGAKKAQFLFPPDLAEKPAHVQYTKVDWLTACRDAFDIELAKLQADEVLPQSPGRRRVMGEAEQDA